MINKEKKIREEDVPDIIHQFRASEHRGKWTKEEQKGLLIKQLRPFWKKLRKLQIKHSDEISKLEEKMNKELKTDIPLEFFYVDGAPVGIGSQDYTARKNFPLIDVTDLEEEIDDFETMERIASKSKLTKEHAKEIADLVDDSVAKKLNLK